MELILPRSAQPAYECQVPGCDAKFYEDEHDKFMRHVPACAARHRERIISVSEEHQAARDADPMDGAFDEEALEWVLKRRRELEGR